MNGHTPATTDAATGEYGNHHRQLWPDHGSVRRLLDTYDGTYDVTRAAVRRGKLEDAATADELVPWLDRLEAEAGSGAPWSGLLRRLDGQTRLGLTQTYRLADTTGLVVTVERTGFPDTYEQVLDALTDGRGASPR
ncbi:MAG: hypothetical protein SVU88_00285 [Candidatus Nanohaloarchaea archaeon]|nr:hypothetical protein [Candidatus Nanohaloarchaea archaeon]